MNGNPYINASAGIGGVPSVHDGKHSTGRGFVYLRGGVKHRTRGPAEVRDDGYKAFWRHGKRHRKGAPAVYHPDGGMEWWEDGKFLKAEKPDKLPPGTKLFKGKVI